MRKPKGKARLQKFFLLVSALACLPIVPKAEANGTPAMLQGLIGARGPCSSLTSTWAPAYSNLAGYWRLAGAIGSIANGASIPAAVGSSATFSNANGSVSPTTGYAQGFMDAAITLDGTDDYITIPYTQSSATAFSIQAWVNFTSTGSLLTIYNNRGSGAGMSLTFGFGVAASHGAAGSVSFELDSNNVDIGVSSTTVVNDGKWHHVVGTWAAASGTAISPSQFAIYIDGAPAALTTGTTGTAPNAPLTGLGNATVGYSQAWGTYFQGSIAEYAIWNVQLTAAQVQTLYSRQLCSGT